jgi:hypothetical protein
LIKGGATIAYWCSDAHGRPANHSLDPMRTREWTARPGLVQEVEGPLRLGTSHALHATTEPHRWAGVRVWLVGLVGEVARARDGRKVAALRREIIGEILPECVFSASVGVRIRRKDLYGEDLRSANLYGANLTSADLRSANLTSADLTSANLTSADLTSANLTSADLTSANLTSAELMSANLTIANLTSSNLYGANLYGANLRSAYYPNGTVPVGWTRDANGYLSRTP